MIAPVTSPGRSAPYFANSRLFYPVRSHQAVWRILRAALRRGEGVTLITGPSGVGKSHFLRRLKDVAPGDRDLGLMTDPQAEPERFLAQLIEALDGESIGEKPVNRLELMEALERRALRERRILIAVDQAEELPEENIDALNLVARFRANGESPAQILLATVLTSGAFNTDPRFAELAPLLVGAGRMTPLSRRELRGYVRFHLERRGESPIRISWRGWRAIYDISQGFPRQINKVMSGVVALAERERQVSVGGRFVRRAAEAGRFARTRPTVAAPRLGVADPVRKPVARALRRWVGLLLALAVAAAVTGLVVKALLIEPVVAPEHGVAVEDVIREAESRAALPVGADEAHFPHAQVAPPVVSPEGNRSVRSVVDPEADPLGAAMRELETVPPTSGESAASSTPSPVNRTAVASNPASAPSGSDGEQEANRNGAFQGLPFVVQMGSFRSRDNAEALVVRLQEHGYSAYVHQTEAGTGPRWYSARLNFATRARANAEANRVERLEETPVLVMELYP